MTQPRRYPASPNHPDDEANALSLMEPLELVAAPRAFVLADIVATGFMRHRVLLVAFVIPVLFGLGAALFAAERFNAVGLMIVLGSRESAGSQDISGFGPAVLSVDQPKIVQSEINIIESDDVVAKVVRTIGPAVLFPSVARGRLFGLLPATPMDLQVQRATELFERDLHADVQPNSAIVRVSFDYPDRTMAITALQALFDAYLVQRQAIFSHGNAKFLAAELGRVNKALEDVAGQIQDTKGGLGVLDVPQAIQLAGSRVDVLETKADALRAQQASSLAQLAEARRRLTEQSSRVFASQEVTNQAPNDDSRNELLKMQVERDHLAEQYSAAYPPLRELDRKIGTIRQAIATRPAISTVREVRNPVAEMLAGRVASLQVDTGSLDRQLEEVERQAAEARGRSTQLLAAEARLSDLDRKQASLDGIYRQFAAREAGARIDESARETRNANVQVVQQPTAPSRGRSMALSYVAGGVVAGLFASIASAIGLTWLRRTYASPAEAERGLGLSVLATFPRSERFDLRENNATLSGLAAMLLDVPPTDRRPVCLVQFLPATDAEGALTARLVRAAAVELARTYGRKTLLVDLRNDGRDHLAELGTQPMRSHDATDGIAAMGTVYPKLWVAFDAQRSVLGDVHAEQAAIRALMDKLRDEFDRVLVIGQSDMDSYAVRRFTVMADANVIVVRGETTRGPDARHVRDMILGSGGPLLGIIYGGQRTVVPTALARLL